MTVNHHITISTDPNINPSAAKGPSDSLLAFLPLALTIMLGPLFLYGIYFSLRKCGLWPLCGSRKPVYGDITSETKENPSEDANDESAGHQPGSLVLWQGSSRDDTSLHGTAAHQNPEEDILRGARPVTILPTRHSYSLGVGLSSFERWMIEHARDQISSPHGLDGETSTVRRHHLEPFAPAPWASQSKETQRAVDTQLFRPRLSEANMQLSMLPMSDENADIEAQRVAVRPCRLALLRWFISLPKPTNRRRASDRLLTAPPSVTNTVENASVIEGPKAANVPQAEPYLQVLKTRGSQNKHSTSCGLGPMLGSLATSARHERDTSMTFSLYTAGSNWTIVGLDSQKRDNRAGLVTVEHQMFATPAEAVFVESKVMQSTEPCSDHDLHDSLYEDMQQYETADSLYTAGTEQHRQVSEDSRAAGLALDCRRIVSSGSPALVTLPNGAVTSRNTFSPRLIDRRAFSLTSPNSRRSSLRIHSLLASLATEQQTRAGNGLPSTSHRRHSSDGYFNLLSAKNQKTSWASGMRRGSTGVLFEDVQRRVRLSQFERAQRRIRLGVDTPHAAPTLRDYAATRMIDRVQITAIPRRIRSENIGRSLICLPGVNARDLDLHKGPSPPSDLSSWRKDVNQFRRCVSVGDDALALTRRPHHSGLPGHSGIGSDELPTLVHLQRLSTEGSSQGVDITTWLSRQASHGLPTRPVGWSAPVNEQTGGAAGLRIGKTRRPGIFKQKKVHQQEANEPKKKQGFVRKISGAFKRKSQPKDTEAVTQEKEQPVVVCPVDGADETKTVVEKVPRAPTQAKTGGKTVVRKISTAFRRKSQSKGTEAVTQEKEHPVVVCPVDGADETKTVVEGVPLAPTQAMNGGKTTMAKARSFLRKISGSKRRAEA